MKGAISALASIQGYLLVASGPKVILHKWTGSDLNGVAFFDAPPLYVVSMNIVSDIYSFMSFALPSHYIVCLRKKHEPDYCLGEL